MACIVFMAGALPNVKFSKPMNSFQLSGFFPSRLALWLRFGVPKSENEFVAPDLYCTMRLVHEVEILGNPKFGLKLKLWASPGLKITQGSSLARISLPCGALRVITGYS